MFIFQTKDEARKKWNEIKYPKQSMENSSLIFQMWGAHLTEQLPTKYYGWIDVVFGLQARNTICISDKIKQLKNIEFPCYYLCECTVAHLHLLSSLTEDINQIAKELIQIGKKYVRKTVIDFKNIKFTSCGTDGGGDTLFWFVFLLAFADFACVLSHLHRRPVV